MINIKRRWISRNHNAMKRKPTTEVNKALKVFRTYCAKKNMRYTPERETIIREIYGLRDHFNVDGLFERIRQNNPQCRIAKTSIYRSVPYFLDAGVLRKSVTDGVKTLYERTLGHFDHDHFRCIECGKIVEFASPALTLAQKKI